MTFHPIQLTDKERYEKYYKSDYRMASDASFTTPYAWAPSFCTAICEQDELMCIQGKNKEGVPYYMMPVGYGNKEKFLLQLFSYCKNENQPFSLHWLLEEDVLLVEKVFGNQLSITQSRNSAEYIYETKSLITLSGKKLHAKRNHINTFKSLYSYEIQHLTKENIAFAREFVIARCNTEEETLAMNRLFDAYFPLCLTGMLLFAENVLCAVTVGEKINCDTALIHLEKAETSFSGAYPTVNQLFIENYFSDTTYINREEDMGIAGLRKAKLSYRPAFLVEKFTAVVNYV